MSKSATPSQTFVPPPIPRPLTIRATSPQVLQEVLKRAQKFGTLGVVVFDLDATIFTNYPRWVHILKEYGHVRGLTPLLHTKPEYINGWSMYVSMVQSGIDPKLAKDLEKDAYQFWAERFYTSEYCREDEPIEGAVDYLNTLRKTGVQIAYSTGRHVGMVEGTISCMERYGMPTPDEHQVHILAKPTLEMDDDAWKEEAYARLRRLGEVIAAFDNEPTHINSYANAFPFAQAVHLLTNDSGRGILVSSHIPSIRNFILP